MPESSAQTIRMSFSGQDADVFAYVPSSNPQNQTKLVLLDSIQTISVSVFRDKVPVRALGFTNVKGHTRGVRTIAGSMIFAILNDHPLWQLVKKYDYEWSFDRYAGAASSSSDGKNIYSDVIPPFNIAIYYQNELGSAAITELIGVDITNDGVVTSIEDLLTEDTMQFRARDMRTFQAVQGANGLDPHDETYSVGDIVENLLLGNPALDNFSSSIDVPVSDGRSLSDKKKGVFSG